MEGSRWGVSGQEVAHGVLARDGSDILTHENRETLGDRVLWSTASEVRPTTLERPDSVAQSTAKSCEPDPPPPVRCRVAGGVSLTDDRRLAPDRRRAHYLCLYLCRACSTS